MRGHAGDQAVEETYTCHRCGEQAEKHGNLLWYCVCSSHPVKVEPLKSGRLTTLEHVLVVLCAVYSVGVILNLAAVHLYGGMPVYVHGIADGTALDAHHVAGYSIIGDYIPFGGWQLSPGDVLMYVGVFLLTILLIAYVVSGGLHRRMSHERWRQVGLLVMAAAVFYMAVQVLWS